jgi:hypothetical protein
VFATLAWVALLVVIIAFAAAFVMKKWRKLILVVTLVFLVAVAIVGSVWFLRAQIYYSFDAVHDYPIAGDNYFTINCQNTGYVVGSFCLKVHFDSAMISSKTNQTYEVLDDSFVRFDYVLEPGQSAPRCTLSFKITLLISQSRLPKSRTTNS